MPAVFMALVAKRTMKSTPSSGSRSCSSDGKIEVATSVVLATGVPHHPPWGMRVRRRDSIDETAMAAFSGLRAAWYRSNSGWPSASRR